MKKYFYTLLKNDTYTPILTAVYKIRNLVDLKTHPDLRSLFRRVRRHTMVSYPRILGLARIAQKLEDVNVPGAFVECGVWKGGCSAVMTYVAKNAAEATNRPMRDVYVFDSFEGLPHVTEHDGYGAIVFSDNKKSGELTPIGQNVATEEEVRTLFSDLGLLTPNVHIVKGWFQHSLPENKPKIGSIALLRLDGDWYESTKACLENLYDNVAPGGYIVLDDYHFWEGCKKAVHEFLESRDIKVDIMRQDLSGTYFVKP